ncbi:MAG TPA: ABC transporter permease [Dongiaceae bacterium]|nr:ABC transporter permease [Dongiaceae bacterium]
MLRILLAKDLRRARRNPFPWVIYLIIPLAVTALLGLALGGNSQDSALGRIRFAVVDEDQSFLTRMLAAAGNRGGTNRNFEPVFLSRPAALELVNANKISAVLIVPAHFTSQYLSGRDPVRVELIKNPAESLHPAVLEELLGATVTGLNALSRNFLVEVPALEEVLAGRGDAEAVGRLADRAGNKLLMAEKMINPPLVWYTGGNFGAKPEAVAAGTPPAGPVPDAGRSGMFAYLLSGMAAMFLLFLGQNGMTDLHRELRLRTFERCQTLREAAGWFVFSKICFTVVMLLICSGILFGGGGLMFHIHWRHPGALLALSAGYAVFVAALFAVLVALVPDERRAGVLNNLAGMALGLAGGCAFPPEHLPDFVRAHLTPWLPSNWFATAARELQSTGVTPTWPQVTVELLVVALLLTLLAAWLFRRRFQKGLRP